MSFQLANGNFQLPGGGPVANGVLTLTLSNPSATVIATGAAATASYTFTLDANGNLPAGSTVLGNNELTPTGTFYTASLLTSGGTPVTLTNNNWVVGPSAPYAGSLFPDVNVYPSLSISGVVPGALEITGSTGLQPTPAGFLWLASGFGTPIVGKIYVGDGTGWELDFAKRVGSVDTTLFKFKDNGQFIGNTASLTLGAASGASLAVGNTTGQAYIDGSGGTGGTGGYISFTNDASNVTGYSCWITNNAFWNGTSWIQTRGVGTSSHGLAVSNHKDFSFNFAAANGTNGAAITWTEWANLNASGFNLKTGVYLVNGVQISASNLSNGVTGSGAIALAASPTFTGTVTAATLNATTLQIGGTTIAGTPNQVTTAFSATPTFSARSAGQVQGFQITLTGNVTSSTLSGAAAGQLLVFKIVQDATGGRTFVWPTNVLNAGTPEPAANTISVQAFYFDGTNAYPAGPMTVN